MLSTFKHKKAVPTIYSNQWMEAAMAQGVERLSHHLELADSILCPLGPYVEVSLHETLNPKMLNLHSSCFH